MFRWLKGKKNRKAGGKKCDTGDDYGFRKRHSPDNSDYGFRDRTISDQESDLQESIYHIYEEIPDLPDLPFSSDGDLRNEVEQQPTSGVSRRPGLDLDRAVEVGPYLIVPIVGRIYEQDDIEIFKKDENISDNSECNNCSCSCQTKVPTLPHYNTPWEFNENLVHNSRLPHVMSDTKVVLTRAVKPRNTFSLTELDPSKQRHCLTTDVEHTMKSNSCSCPSARESRTINMINRQTYSDSSKSSSERGSFGYLAHTDSEDGNDTCCEYDMSTSSESDIADNVDYRTYLEKVERNLLMKHDVKRLLTGSDVDNNNDSPPCCDHSEVDSITSVSSLSCHSSSSTPAISCEEVSDDSSGYYECAEDSLVPKVTTSGCTKHASNKPKTDNPEKTKEKSGKSRNGHKKSKQHHSANLKYTHVFQCSDENKEMYLIPSNKRSSFKLTTQRAPLLPPERTLIYQDPCRIKTGSQNRLLSDLIRMNYNRQLLIH